jgi:deferrochelatase/peroxidase EfeB
VRPSGHFVVICRAAPGSRLPRHRRRSLLRDVGLGSDAWDRLFGQPRPAELHPFLEIKAGLREAIATPGDLLFHIPAKRVDLCFELAKQITARLGNSVSVVDEVHGFRYFDDRDLIGFVDARTRRHQRRSMLPTSALKTLSLHREVTFGRLECAIH